MIWTCNWNAKEYNIYKDGVLFKRVVNDTPRSGKEAANIARQNGETAKQFCRRNNSIENLRVQMENKNA